jgi:hypothetical protein
MDIPTVCETWSLKLREEHRLRVFENRALRRIFGLRLDEVMEGWRKLHNKELRDLYTLPTIIRIMKSRRMRWTGHVARMGEKRNACRLLLGKPEGRRSLGRPRHRWVNNSRMDLGVVGWNDVDWIGLAQDRDKWRSLVKMLGNYRVTSTADGLLSSAQLHGVSYMNIPCIRHSMYRKVNTCTHTLFYS